MALMAPLPRPVSDTTAVRELCECLVPGAIPKVLKVDAPPWAQVSQCTENVAKVIEEFGGQIDYGWQLWEPLPGLMIEAEFHAVWLDADGDPHDVTPKGFPGITNSVFLADPNLDYKGQQINNVRVALTDDPVVEKLIQAFNDEFEVMNRGELANYHGEITLTSEMRKILDRKQRLFMQVVQKHY